jgi:hypothetical protein
LGLDPIFFFGCHCNFTIHNVLYFYHTSKSK